MQFPQTLGLSDEEQANLQTRWSTFGTVETGILGQLCREGFTPLPMPPYARPGYLALEELATQDSKTLTRLFAQYEAWRAFADERGVYVRMILVETTNELTALEVHTKKRLRAERGGGRGSKAPTKDEIIEECRSDVRYETLKIQEQQLQQQKDYYAVEVERNERSSKLVSRIITMRGQDIELNNRSGNVGAQGGGYGSGRPPRL